MNRALTLLILVLFSAAAAIFFWSRSGEVYRLRLGASKVGSDSYGVAEAIAATARLHFPGVQIEVVATGGSSDSIQQLREGRIDLAAVQSDVPIAQEARLVAELYPDVYQLLVHRDAGVESVAELAGKRLGLPKATSGQYASFLLLAKHYGLSAGDFVEVTVTTGAEGNRMLAAHELDALFRVRPPGNESVRELVAGAPVRLVAIDQADAMKLREPSLQRGVIARGSYRGHPAVPSIDMPTVAVPRLLVAHEGVPGFAVARITEVLFEYRKDLVTASNLAGFIKQPDRSAGTFLPLHEGASNYYSRAEPNFLQEQAEPIALMITIVAVLLSAFVQLQRRRQSLLVQKYNREVLSLLQESEHLDDPSRLATISDRLNVILREVVARRNSNKITPEDFEFFSFVWEMARDEANERLPALPG